MEYSKSVNFFNLFDVKIKYFETKHGSGDNDIDRYDDYKISIRLTDGLFGVQGTEIVGGMAGDVLLFGPDEIHFGRFTKSGLHRYIHIFLPTSDFDALCLKYPILDCLFNPDYPGRTNCIRGKLGYKEKIIEIGEGIVSCLKCGGSDKDLTLVCRIVELLSVCTELYDSEIDFASDVELSPYTRHAIEYIAKRYSEKITVEDVAGAVGCSTVYLSKTFKSDTGKTVYGYITEYRIRKSALLLKSGANVTEACYAVGFSDSSNFIRTFKKLLSISPKQYRKQVYK